MLKQAWEEVQTAQLLLRQGLYGESCLKSFEGVKKVIRVAASRKEAKLINDNSLLELAELLSGEERGEIYPKLLFLEKFRWLKSYPFIREAAGGEPSLEEAEAARECAQEIFAYFTTRIERGES